MVSKQKTIFVCDDFSMQNPTLMGTLYVNSMKGGESCSFEYDREWLKKTSLEHGKWQHTIWRSSAACAFRRQNLKNFDFDFEFYLF